MVLAMLARHIPRAADTVTTRDGDDSPAAAVVACLSASYCSVAAAKPIFDWLASEGYGGGNHDDH